MKNSLMINNMCCSVALCHNHSCVENGTKIVDNVECVRYTRELINEKPSRVKWMANNRKTTNFHFRFFFSFFFLFGFLCVGKMNEVRAWTTKWSDSPKQWIRFGWKVSEHKCLSLRAHDCEWVTKKKEPSTMRERQTKTNITTEANEPQHRKEMKSMLTQFTCLQWQKSSFPIDTLMYSAFVFTRFFFFLLFTIFVCIFHSFNEKRFCQILLWN